MNETYTPTLAQQKAIDETGKILVSAAAGSGKTKTMINRILKLVGSGASLRRMLILVYNNASAEELKEKLHQGLFEKACEAVGDMRELYRRQLDELSFSSICTIHSFCQSLIRENFDKLLVPPTFSILDEKRHLAYMNRAIESVFAEYFAENDTLFNDLANIFSQGRSEDNLKNVVLKLYNFVDIQPSKEGFLANVDSCYKSFENGAFADIILKMEKKTMRAVASECEKLLTPLSTLGQLSYFDNVEKLKRMADAMVGALNFTTILDIAKGGFDKGNARIKGKTEDIKYWVERAKTIINFASDDIKALSSYFCDINSMKQAHVQNARYIGKLLEIVDRFALKLEELKACDGVLSFSDLEHKAVQLLSQGGNYGENFDYVFVDEYQDVNPTQEYIITNLVRDNCFMVGDVKQSIYGFRLADPTIFLAREKDYKQGGGTEISFNKNFRSDQSILNFVNGIF
ncbi:MAG: UvrD-helicase domain-containing protein, partial [Clostridia bacterium]